VTARYWEAIAATNMTGHVLRTVQVDAAARALSLYRAAGQPRRIYTGLINLSRHLGAQRQDAAAQVALDEARGLIRPDWPVELHHRLLLREASIARGAGRFGEALARIHDAVRVGASSGDWRLEAMARNNLADLLWELGPIDEAARVACKLAGEFRTKPAADGDMAVLFANLIGIQSEMGRIDEASTAAREAIPIMRRARYSYIEEWLYLFWRRGQLDTAAVLLGASDAERLRYGTPHQENERRLIAQARAALEARMDSDALASLLTKGAALQEGEWLPLVSHALAQPNGNLS
jgi:tetratricopeptide (TPR) repeat protein